jgi:hypothetical protein
LCASERRASGKRREIVETILGQVLRRFYPVIGTFTIVVLMHTSLDAQQPYSRTSQLLCDGVKIQVVTQCLDDSNLATPDCTMQTFSFLDKSGERTVSKPASGKSVTVKDAKGKSVGRYLDALATDWLCLKGRVQSYLVVWYSTGGNCDECEWQEVLDLKGKRLASTLPKTRNNLMSYDAVWREAGLPNVSPSDYSSIELKNRHAR